MKKALLALYLVAVMSTPALAFPKPADWGNNEWYQFFEQAVTTAIAEAPGAVAETFGGVSAAPMTDVYSALSGMSAAVKPGLIMWLRNKRVAAELNGDTEKGELYQAYETALANEDNSRLKQLLDQYDAKKRGASAQQSINLTGMWQTTVNGQVRQIKIEQNGKEVKAIKLTPSIYVPAGRTTWYGTFNANPFDGLGQWAKENYTEPAWAPVRIKVNSNDSISVTALDSNYDSQELKRVGK